MLGPETVENIEEILRKVLYHEDRNCDAQYNLILDFGDDEVVPLHVGEGGDGKRYLFMGLVDRLDTLRGRVDSLDIVKWFNQDVFKEAPRLSIYLSEGRSLDIFRTKEGYLVEEV
ncbi:MAG: hypothetical protein CMH64_02320 [Nanoarchaeota archaeon]|nr:hypothetical protein [Nanoarchaeota archaeon]|tara:strand:+ start:1985 stop:2329 length:345 start_codon:yes stop_codon:yes gene_type:complete